MMAKMFYTLDETKSALGKNDDEIKQLVHEARLREFRDGPKLMFKADQVEQLKSELGGTAAGDVVNLGPSDTGGPIGLVDTRGASGSGISLVDTGTQAGVAGPGKPADVGLSGSVGGVPSPGRVSAGGSKAGVSVFDVDDSQKADASAQTTIGAGIQDQVNLEGVGSGSGLLDLTRERDDTSLGAVFEDLSPGAAAGAPGTAATKGNEKVGTGAGMTGLRAPSVPHGGSTPGAIQFVEAPDASATAFGGAALAATLVVLFGGFVVGSAVLNYHPAVVDTMIQNGSLYLGLGAVAIILFGIIGFFIGRTGSSAR